MPTKILHRNRAADSAHRAPFETLEDRRLMSAVPLVIGGTAGSDVVRVRQSGTTLTVTRNGVATTRGTSSVSQVVINAGAGSDNVMADASVKVPVFINGGAGDDWLRGGTGKDVVRGEAGNDHLFGGAGGSDSLDGGDGDDVLVTIGGRSDADKLAGGSGHDNFWVDSGGVDRVADTSASGDEVHAVSSFMSYRIQRPDGSYTTTPVPTSLLGQDLADPVASKYARGSKDFASSPLFASSGPDEADVDQNAAADCYFLAPLSSLADVAPDRLLNRAVDLGDGTYAVHFTRDGADVFVRVDGDLPVDGSGSPFYAGLGRERSIWAPILEKAWAFFRKSRGTYLSTDFGKISEIYRALDIGGTRWESGAAAYKAEGGMLEAIDSFLDDGCSVVYSSRDAQPSGSKLRGNHVLMVDRVVRNSRGVATVLVLRDPYRSDGSRVADGANDGYITLTASEAAAWMEGVVSCNV